MCNLQYTKRFSFLTSSWFFGWIIRALKNSFRRVKHFLPDPKRSLESVFKGKMASLSHVWEKIQQRIHDVSNYQKAAIENLKEKAEVASEAAHKLKGVISDASSSSMSKLENLKEKMDSVYYGLKDETLPGYISKARSKMNFFALLPSQIPTCSAVIKTIKPYFWKIVLIFIGLYSAKIIIGYLLSRFEDLVQWILKKSGECLLILLKKIWSLIVQGITFIWNRIRQRWQNNNSERQDTDPEAPNDCQNNNQASSEGQKVDASTQTESVPVNNNGHSEEARVGEIIQESEEIVRNFNSS